MWRRDGWVCQMNGEMNRAMSAAAPLVPYNLERFPDLHPALDSQSAAAEANRCLFCFDAPCTAACPTHIDVPRFIKKIATGNLRGSALTILDANILGLSCSRVCPVDVLCEGSCVMHRYNKKPIEIGLLQRHAMEAFYSTRASLPPPDFVGQVGNLRRGPEGAPNPPLDALRKIACIGAGPASLACAAEIRRHGHSATVFDRRPLAGGLNTYGVAEYKLRPSDSLREVEMIRGMGVEFQQADIDLAALNKLEKEFDFIFVGAGLGAMDRLGIPGEDLPHVIDALHFIASYKTRPAFSVGRCVAVIGGGNTAIDAANAALRLGAAEVHMFYRRTETQMPAFPFEYEHAKVENVQFHWLAQPVEILADRVRFIRTKLAHHDATGRRQPEPVPGSEFDFACDMVIPALGQSRMSELKRRVDNKKYFAGGDFVNGGREVVDAVADGKRAAQSMLQSNLVPHV
jgi:dihydropyrimidine dehydrogenase (NAD+) subunit PreT